MADTAGQSHALTGFYMANTAGPDGVPAAVPRCADDAGDLVSGAAEAAHLPAPAAHTAVLRPPGGDGRIRLAKGMPVGLHVKSQK